MSRRSVRLFISGLAPQEVILAFALALLLALALTPRVCAQGTMGMLPGPISTQELDGYAQRLALSPQQRRALDAIHDQYKQEFRVLRDGEIAAFLKTMREMDSGGSMPPRKKVEDFLQQMDALSRKIAALDNRLFDQLQNSLTEEQLLMMPRARMARQRDRMDSMQLMWMGGERPMDISALAFGLELSAADRAAADVVLSPYETRLTGDMEKLYASSHKTILGMYESLEKAGITEESLQDPAQAEKLAQAMQQVWMDMMTRNQEMTAAIAELNDRTQRSIVATLSPDAARQFRNRYHARAYPEAAFALYPHDYVFAPALKREDLTAEQREAVTTIRDEMQRKLDAMLDQTVRDIVAWRKSMNPFEYDQQKAEEYQKKQMNLRTQCDKIRSDANVSLEAALGKELLDKIGRLKTIEQEPQEELVAGAVDGDLGQTVEMAEAKTDDGGEEGMEQSYGVDQFLPAAISEMELRDAARQLALTDEQNAVMRELHQRYMESFQTLYEGEVGSLQKAVATMWSYDEQTQTSTAPTTETINEVYRLRAAALAAIRKTDESFFAEVELAVLTPEQTKNMPRVRALRDRVTYNRMTYYWGGENNEASIDLSRLIFKRASTVPESERASLDVEMIKYEQALLPLLKERYARSLETQKVQELWQAEITRAQAEGDANNIKLGLRYQELMREPQRALADASEAVAKLNRTTIDAVCAMLSPEASQSLRREYNRWAFPNVYGDTGAMDKYLSRAAALPDLTPDQAQRLGETAASYLPAYAAVCEEMVAASSGPQRNPYLATIEEEEVDDWQRREETLSKLRFDRAELNSRAASQVREILSEDQVKRLGPPPVSDQEKQWD